MTIYTYQPPSSVGNSANWSDPKVWAGGVVPNSSDADVIFPTITEIATGNEHPVLALINYAETFSVNSVQLRNPILISGSLNVAGQLSQYGSGGMTMNGGTIAVGSLVNNAQIQGGGGITANSLTNNQLIIGSGLGISAVSLTNVGTLAASQGLLTLSVPGDGFTNLSNGTLTGGSYRALPSGIVSFVSGSVITVDAANISLEGGSITSRDGSVLGRPNDIPLTTSLTSIAPSGVLTIVNSSYTFGPLNVSGNLALTQGGHIASSQLVVGSGGMITGAGFVDSAVANDGVIKPTEYGQTLVLNGAITGRGILEITAGFVSMGLPPYPSTASYTLEINAPASQNVVFDNNIGILRLDKPLAFTGAIATSGAGDRIVLANVSATAITGISYAGDATGGTLTLQKADGSIPIKFAGHSYTTSSFTLSAGPQTLSSDPPSLVITVNGNTTAAAQDFNGDRHSDILWQNVNGAISTWQATGSGASDGIVRDTYDAQVAASWSAIDSFDFNGDGKSDILWRNQNGAVAVWNGTTSGFAQSSYVTSSIPATTVIAGAGDFDGDGKGDLLLRNGDGSISTSISTGIGFQSNAYSHASVGTSWMVEGVADFTGDGKADILWRNTDGSLSTWNSLGTGFQENSTFHQPIARSWHVVGLGDFNGDGTADILWRNDSGALSAWTSAAAGFTENQFNAAAPNNWSVGEVGDFNGDGKADILWRNTAGQISIWHSTGSGWQQNTFFDSSVGTDWMIVAHHFPF